MQNLDISSAAKEYGIERLRQITGLSRSHIYGILEGRIEPKISTYQKLLEALGFRLEIKKASLTKGKTRPSLNDKDYFKWSLAYYGAPFIIEQHFDSAPPLEDVLLKALSKGRKDASIHSILPSFIYKNWKDISWEKVIKVSSEPIYLGYLINLIFHFTNDMEINTILSKIQKKHRPKRLQPIIKKGKINSYQKKRLKNTDNIIADAWKLQTADNLIDLEERFKKWQSSSQ